MAIPGLNHQVNPSISSKRTLIVRLGPFKRKLIFQVPPHMCHASWRKGSLLVLGPFGLFLRWPLMTSAQIARPPRASARHCGTGCSAPGLIWTATPSPSRLEAGALVGVSRVWERQHENSGLSAYRVLVERPMAPVLLETRDTGSWLLLGNNGNMFACGGLAVEIQPLNC